MIIKRRNLNDSTGEYHRRFKGDEKYELLAYNKTDGHEQPHCFREVHFTADGAHGLL